MRSISAAIFAIALFAALIFVPAVADQSDSDAPEGATVIGYIANTSGKDFSTVSSVEIAIYDITVEDNPTEVSKTSVILTDTDEEMKYYKFQLTGIGHIDVNKCCLFVNISGYSVLTCQSSCLLTEPISVPIRGIQQLCYKFNPDFCPTGFFESGTSYQIGSATPVGTGIMLKSASGTITGKITTDTASPVSLNGVRVNIFDSADKIVASGLTADNGQYRIICETGTYKIVAELNNYKTYTGTVTVYDDNLFPGRNEQPDIKLTESQPLFGTDLPHVLMMVGLALSVILIVMVVFHRLRIFGKHEIIYDDEPAEDTEKKDHL